METFSLMIRAFDLISEIFFMCFFFFSCFLAFLEAQEEGLSVVFSTANLDYMKLFINHILSGNVTS